MESSASAVQNVLVIAAAGKTGRRVADLLEQQGISVRRGSRGGSPSFDWQTPDTWAQALAGMDAAYVVYTPDLAVPSAESDLTKFVKVAREAGLKKLVLLSGRGEPEAQRCELIVQNSGIAWTVVRAAWFSQNFSEGEFTDMVNAGQITLPNPDVQEPFVDVDDIAEVAAAAIMDSKHDSQVYEVTGPELLTFADVAAALSSATGRDINYIPLTQSEFSGGLEQAGVPKDFIDLLEYLFSRMASGDNAHTTDGVMRALGRPPKSFFAYATDAAAVGAWATHAIEEQSA